MQLQQDIHDGQFHIKSYKPGELCVNNETYHHHVIIGVNHLSAWSVQSFNEINNAHLDPIINLKPTIALLGTGEDIALPKPELLAAFYEKGIGVEFMTTSAACRTFEVLAAEGRNVVAGLII